METMKTFQDLEVTLPSEWTAKYRPKAFRPAVVGDWVYLPIANHALKLTAGHEANLGKCHLILEPILPDPKEWWPRWLKARWLFGGQDSQGRWVWCVSNANKSPNFSQWMSLLNPNILDLSFIPEVEPKDACFKNPWLDEEKTPA